MRYTQEKFLWTMFTTGLLCLGSVCPLFGQGVALRAVSAINEGMAGVATATPVDSVGALNWNPATISAFEKSDMSFGAAMILANARVESSFLGYSGRTTSDTGAVPAPYMGMILADPDKAMTYGFGLFSIGGAQSNYPNDPNNPILSSTYGIGRTAAKVEAFQMVPTASVRLTERLSIGAAPTITIARLIAEPLFFGPSDASGHWGQGAGTRYVWGAGFQVGVYYKLANHLNIGACYKSENWSEKFPYNVTLPDGTSHQANFKLNYPAIMTYGLSYDGFDKTIIGVDLRHFNYGKTPGFGDSGFNPDGSAKGLGWKSVFAVSTAIQRQLNDKLTIRGGYSFNENPIGSEAIMSNIPCPLIMQHGLHLGASVEFREDWFATIGYAHMFRNSIEGDNPYWAIDPNSYVRSMASADAISFGVNKSF